MTSYAITLPSQRSVARIDQASIRMAGWLIARVERHKPCANAVAEKASESRRDAQAAAYVGMLPR